MNSPVLYRTQAKPINPLNALTVQVTASLLMFERGKLSSSTQQIPMSQVQDVDTSQSMTQKARNVGSVIVHVLRGRSASNWTTCPTSEPCTRASMTCQGMRDSRR